MKNPGQYFIQIDYNINKIFRKIEFLDKFLLHHTMRHNK